LTATDTSSTTAARDVAAAPVATATDAITSLAVRGCMRRPATEREVLATRVYERLHPVMAALGLLFVAVVLAERGATNGSTLAGVLTAATWCLWATFFLEYLLRLVIAPNGLRFLRRTWWQLAFLAVPFLTMLRILLVLRVARPTRVLLAAFRSTRSARSKLSTRTGWLALTTAIVAFSSADVVYQYGEVRPYGRALHASAMAAINGTAIPSDRGIAQLLDVALAIYAVVLFASLAGTVGAYFLEQHSTNIDDGERVSATARPSPQPGSHRTTTSG
jgi:voltage-gated potassium channel